MAIAPTTIDTKGFITAIVERARLGFGLGLLLGRRRLGLVGVGTRLRGCGRLVGLR